MGGGEVDVDTILKERKKIAEKMNHFKDLIHLSF